MAQQKRGWQAHRGGKHIYRQGCERGAGISDPKRHHLPHSLIRRNILYALSVLAYPETLLVITPDGKIAQDTAAPHGRIMMILSLIAAYN
jgi:hypothetical protein